MPKATVVITANNQLKKGMDPAKKTMLEFQNMVSGIQSKISKAFSIAGVATAAVAGLKMMANAAKECVNAYVEAEKVTKRLSSVWDNVGEATGKTSADVSNLAEALEKETYFSSEAIKESALLLAATESLTEEGFDRALNASLDLAAALGEDVTSAAQTLAKAIQEPETALSRLKTIGVSFTDEEKAQIKALADANQQYEAQAIILDKIESKYEGVAKAIADTPAGKLDAIRDTLGDIRETIGQGIVEALDPAFTFILNMLTKINQWAKDHMDQSLFWKDVNSGDSSKLYKNYSQDFLIERQTDALEDVATELEMLKSDRWGQILEENFDMALEDILLLDRNVVMEQMKKDASIIFGENYADYIGTAEGFFERVTDQYDPLVGVLNTINDALAEYTDLYIEKPSAATGSSSVIPATTATENALAAFLQKNGNVSIDYQVRALRETVAAAEMLRDSLENASTAEASKMLEDAGIKASPTATIGWLNDIIDSTNEKIDGLLDEGPTEIEKILNDYGKDSKTHNASILREQISRIEAVYEQASSEDQIVLGEILGSLNEQLDALEGLEKEVTSGSFLDTVTDAIASGFVNLGLGNAEQAMGAAGTIVQTFVDNLGEAGTLIQRLATNMSTMTPVLGAIVTALQYVIEGFAESIGPLLEDFVKDGVEPLRELGRAIGEILSPILEEVMPLVEESARILMGVFDALAVVLKPIVSFIATALTPIIQQLTMVLEIIEPILKVIGGVLITITTAFQWVADWIRYAFASVANWLADIEIFGYHPFGGMRTEANKPKSYGEMWQENWDKMNQGYEASTINSNAVDQAISSASYRGATNVTINIYAEGPIVGDGGMREFAQMIREEFDALNYYGVSA